MDIRHLAPELWAAPQILPMALSASHPKPPLYWDGMLEGREWMAQPERVG